MDINTDKNVPAPLFTVSDKDMEAHGQAVRRELIIISAAAAFSFAVSAVSAVQAGKNPLSLIILAAVLGMIIAEQLARGKAEDPHKYNIYYFYEDGYANYDLLSRAEIPYSLVIKAVETDKLIMLYTEPNRAHCILKSAVTQGTAEELGSFLRTKIMTYKRRRR